MLQSATAPPDLAWFTEARRQGTTTGEALAFFDRLDPVPEAAMIGLWKGSGFGTGHPLDGLLDEYGWYGKEFVDRETVHPLLFARGGQKPVALNPKFVPMGPSPVNLKGNTLLPPLFALIWPLIRTRKPAARLRMTEYRGKVSATMIYDALPINDIFRQVAPGVLFAAMDSRAIASPFFFVLERAPTT